MHYLSAAYFGTLILYAAIFLVKPCLALDPPSDSLVISNNDTNVILHDIAQQFTFLLGSYNGLEVQDTVSENGETRGLDLVRRVPAGVSSLGNNQFKTSDIKLGETQWWYFPKESVNGKKSNATSGLPENISDDGSAQTVSSDELRKREGDIVRRSTSVYLSLTMCSKPEINNTNGTTPDSVPSLPELNLYVSTSESLQKPGPGHDSSQQKVFTADEGYVGATVQADGDVFIGIAVQNSTAYSGYYTYEIAASIDAYFHSVVDEPFLHFVDADIHAALLTTDNLTLSSEGSENYQQWMNLTPPFTMFAHNVNDTAISGLERSYCALEQLAQIGKGDGGVKAGMTNRGLGKKPKEQFYISGLNRTSNYSGILAMDGNSTNSGNGIVGGGGRVWKPMYFATKSGEQASRPCLSLLSNEAPDLHQMTTVPSFSTCHSAPKLHTQSHQTLISRSHNLVRRMTNMLSRCTKTFPIPSIRSNATQPTKRATLWPWVATIVRMLTSNGFVR
jgi:hypothetical protein